MATMGALAPLAFRLPFGRTPATKELKLISALIRERVPGLFERAGSVGADVPIQARRFSPGVVGGFEFERDPKWLGINREWLTPKNRDETVSGMIHEMFHPLVRKMPPKHLQRIAERAEFKLPFQDLEDIVASPGTYYEPGPGSHPNDVLEELVTRLMEQNVMRKRFPDLPVRGISGAEA